MQARRYKILRFPNTIFGVGSTTTASVFKCKCGGIEYVSTLVQPQQHLYLNVLSDPEVCLTSSSSTTTASVFKFRRGGKIPDDPEVQPQQHLYLNMSIYAANHGSQTGSTTTASVFKFALSDINHELFNRSTTTASVFKYASWSDGLRSQNTFNHNSICI